MKKVLIGGCSFSQKMIWENGVEDGSWVAWTDLFQKEYGTTFEIINRAKSSFGQSKIVESLLDELIKYNFEVDYVIIQWSAVLRGYITHYNDFFDKITKQGEIDFLPYIHEYLSDPDKVSNVTNINDLTELTFYKASLNQIFLMKSLLEYKNIPFTMFWGWEQITPNIEFQLGDLLNQIYSDSFWRYKKHGGMNEYLIESIGETNAILHNDFHPSSKGHRFFYDNIIKELIKKI